MVRPESRGLVILGPSLHPGPRPAPEWVSGKPHKKRTSEPIYIRILSGGSFGGRKGVDLRPHSPGGAHRAITELHRHAIRSLLAKRGSMKYLQV
jgi:hypothetical protein